MNKALQIISLAILMPLMASAQTKVADFHPGQTNDGVCYALPQTQVNVDVYARKVVYTPGEFAKYADRYLHIGGVSQNAETTYAVTDLKVRQTGVVDKNKLYTVKMKDKTLAPLMSLSPSGLLIGINSQRATWTDFQLPAAVQTNHRLDSRKFFTEDMLNATSMAKMAEMAAQEILDIRDSKNTIRRGQAENMPKDGASLKIVLDDLDLQEEALMQLFVGYRDTLTYAQTFSVVPAGDVERDVVFRFSRWNGFVDNDDLSGEPYYFSVTNQHSVPVPTEKDMEKFKVTGIVYNIPGSASVRVFTHDKVLYQAQDVPFAQFGTVDQLMPALFDKNATTRVTFNPVTGGLQHIEK